MKTPEMLQSEQVDQILKMKLKILLKFIEDMYHISKKITAT